MYAKIFASMYDGTLATEGPWEALVTFQQMLVLSDRFGIVDMTAEAISRRTTIPLEIIERGIKVLESPDTDSRRPDSDGRRIVRLQEHRDWGWEIVNHAHYRQIRSAEERREYQREYMREYRKGELRKSETIKGERGQKGRVFDIETLPSEWRTFCTSERTDLDPDKTFAKFRDHWAANANQKTAKKSDWLAAWRNWVRREPKDRNAVPDYSSIFNKQD